MDCQDEEASDRGVGATAGIENGDGDALLPHDRSSANQVPGSCDREPVAADASQLPIAVQDHEFVANDFSITYAEQHSPDAPDVAAELGPFAGAAALPQSQPQLPSTDRDRLPSNDSAVDRQRDADLDHIAAEVLDAVPAAQTSAPPAANHPDSDSGTVVVLTAASDEALVAAGPVAAPEASASDSATPAHIAAPNTAPHPPPASPSPVAAGFLARFPLDNLRAVRSEHQLLSSRGGTGSPHGSRTRLDAAFRSRSGYIYESKSGPRAASGTLDRRGEVVTKPSSEAPAGDFEDRVELTRVADLDGVSRTVVTRRSQLIFVPMEGEEHEVTDNTACASTDVQQQQHQQQQQQQEGSPLDDADSHAMAYISDEGNAGVDAAPERSTDMEHNPVAQIDLMERIYQDGGINERSSSQRNLKHSAYEDSRIITKELLLDDTNADPVRITRVSFSVHDVSAASTTDRPQSSRTLPPSAHPTLSPVSFSHIPRLVSPRRHMASNEPNTLSIHYSASSAATGRGSVKQSDAKVQTPSRIPVVRDRALAIQTAIAVESARFTSADPNARYVSHESKRQHQNNGIEPHAAVLQAAGQRAVSFDVTKEAAVTRGAAAADRPQRNGHQEGVSADDQAIDDGSNSAPLVLDQPHASHPSEANQGDGGIGDSGEPDPVQSRHEDASGQTAGHEPSPDTTTQQTTGLQNKSPKRKKHIFKRPHLASTAIETPKEIRPGHANLLLTANGLYVRDAELQGDQSKIPLRPSERSTTALSWYQDNTHASVGPCLPSLDSRPISQRFKQKFRMNRSAERRPDDQFSPYSQPLPLARDMPVIQKPLDKRHKLMREFKTRREMLLQEVYLGPTSVNPRTFLKHVTGLQRPDLAPGAESQPLAPTFNVAHPSHETYAILGNVHWREQAMTDADLGLDVHTCAADLANASPDRSHLVSGGNALAGIASVPGVYGLPRVAAVGGGVAHGEAGTGFRGNPAAAIVPSAAVGYSAATPRFAGTPMRAGYSSTANSTYAGFGRDHVHYTFDSEPSPYHVGGYGQQTGNLESAGTASHGIHDKVLLVRLHDNASSQHSSHAHAHAHAHSLADKQSTPPSLGPGDDLQHLPLGPHQQLHSHYMVHRIPPTMHFKFPERLSHGLTRGGRYGNSTAGSDDVKRMMHGMEHVPPQLPALLHVSEREPTIVSIADD